jgi:acyl-CoA reductase-like NAD-dependent aldehyde dehydrogenase
MSIMMEETFGPVVGVMKVCHVSPLTFSILTNQVSSDAEAIKLMNDTPFGLTASIWTDPASLEVFEQLSDELDTGTVYLNGADFVDANLAWAGVKDSGRGRALSKLGYDGFIRTKSMNVKLSQD